MKKLLITLAFLTGIGKIQGQDEHREFTVHKINSTIKLDGLLDESVWADAESIGDYWQYFPSDTSFAERQTWVAMLYDDHNLYIGIRCYASNNNFIASTLKRDYRASDNENITFLFDPFNDRNNAFLFGISSNGVLRESLVSGGGKDFRRSFDSSWDNKWNGEAVVDDDHYSAEIAIPFTTLRYNEGSLRWSFNSYRYNLTDNERSTWTKIPRNYSFTSLAFMGYMNFEEPLKGQGPNISLIPYASGAMVSNYVEGVGTTSDWGLGGDIKVAVTPSLNLDLTVNPDFSQVEVDRQITNLSRFEISFPERRQFFTENADLFGDFGTDRINPFFSRRIGISRDTTTDLNIENPIWFGARLSGKLTDNWRVGLLNMQTADDPDIGLPSFNYLVTAVQRQVFQRSNIGLIFVNKQHFSSKYDDFVSPYNRVIGLDYNIATPGDLWTGKIFYHHSLNEDEGGRNFAHGAAMTFKKRLFEIKWEHQWVGPDYNAAVGFVPRKDFFTIRPNAQLNFAPQTAHVNRFSIGFETELLWKPDEGKTDHRFEVNGSIDFTNTSNIRMNVFNEYILLTSPFDPTRSDAEELPEDSDYSNFGFNLSFRSDSRKPFSYRISPTIAEFYNGMRFSVNGDFSIDYRPYGTVGISYNYNRIDLPKPFGRADLILIGPRVDLNLSKSLFFSTLVQYNNQIQNMNLNARLQWRFKPVSDLYIVYTDNYLTENFSIRNRSLVFKITYWLNL